MKDNEKDTDFQPHAISTEAVLDALDSRAEGISTSEAETRLQEFGPNRLPAARGKHPILRFLGHFNDTLIYVLLVAAAGTAWLGHWIDTWIILAVVLVNGLVGYLQEGKAEKAIEAVRGMLSVSSRLLRDGEKRTTPAEDIVPGDVVLLAPGDRVPADLRILEARELRIDEASLTGESEAVEKSVEPTEADVALGDRTSMAYSSTIVASGTATGVAVATGSDTEIGRINQMLSDVETLTTPLIRQVNRFGIHLSLVILLTAGATFSYGFFLAGQALEDIFLSVVGLAVAAIPEGLPAVMSIILAIGVRRMADRNAIIRRLPGVETLGAVSVICTDKTGTLTKSEMTVTRVLLADETFEVEGAGYAPEGRIASGDRTADLDSDAGLARLLVAGAVCNEARLLKRDGAWTVDGNPTEGALLALAPKAGLDLSDIAERWKQIDSVPFSSERKYMATLNDTGNERRIFLKGAPETVLKRCDRQTAADGSTGDLEPDRWRERAEALAGEGFRLLAVAEAAAGDVRGDEIPPDRLEGGFSLLGFAAITDPPRPEAIEAVEECRRAGIRVKMITGDHARTAAAIAREMGIGDDNGAMTGPEIEKTDDETLAERVEKIDVFARVSPEHKLRLVSALQKKGHITAMTGDGVNDAPALKKADIGIAMGRKGTEAAKEAAEMVLADDNFASIAHAVEEGRTVYDNLRKSLLFILPTNGGEAMVILVAVAFGLSMPITPVQVLWVNMVTAVTLALALAFEPMESDVMDRPPRRPDESLVPGPVLARIAYVSVLLMAAALGMFLWRIGQGASESLARTHAVNTLVVGEIFYLFNSRYMRDRSLSIRGLRATPQVWGAVLVVLLLQIPFTYFPPMQNLFGTEAIGPMDWLWMFAAGLVVFLVVEAEKAATRRLRARRK
jgi:magnesium-transporting ATPase (P-type)